MEMEVMDGCARQAPNSNTQSLVAKLTTTAPNPGTNNRFVLNLLQLPLNGKCIRVCVRINDVDAWMIFVRRKIQSRCVNSQKIHMYEYEIKDVMKEKYLCALVRRLYM